MSLVQLQPGKSLHDTLYEDYNRHVRSYASRSFSHDEDIYDALSGVARALYKDDYSFHCGLPELHFDQALLWYCKEGTGIERMRRCEGVQLPSWSWASLSSRIIDRDYDLGCSSFCSSLVPWVICTSKYGKPHFHILETNGEPATWRRWRKFWDNHTCPQLFLALALEEGMMETGFQLPCNIPEKTFSSLEKLFTRLWPTCQCALDALVDRSQDIIHIDSEGGFLEKNIGR